VTEAELTNRFSYHPPKAATVVEDHQDIRQGCKTLAVLIDQVCYDGREKAVALTKLEEVMFWANASIARQ
jgi:hypothetical protein